MCTRASCNLRLLSVPSYRLSRVNGGGGVHSPPRDITTRECLRPAPCQPAHPPTLQPRRLYRAPRGRALIYLKDEVDVKLPGFVTAGARTARFSRISVFTSIFILDFCPYRRRFIFLVHSQRLSIFVRVVNLNWNFHFQFESAVAKYRYSTSIIKFAVKTLLTWRFRYLIILS